MKELKEKVDSNNLNEVISLSKKILKILYVVIVIAGIYGLTIICKEWHVGGFFLEVLRIVAPLFIGLIIAWLFNPFVNKLQKKGLKRGLGSTLTYILFIGIIALIIGSIIPMIMDQINDFVKFIPSVFDTIKSWLEGIFSKVGNIANFDSTSMKNDIFMKIEEYGTGLTQNLPGASIGIIKSVFSGISTFAIGLIIGFFLLVSFDGANNLLSFLPIRFRKDTKDLGNEIDGSLRKYVSGTLILSTLVFLVTSLGLGISGLKSPLLFGLFCGITNVIPFVGPYIGGAPAVIVGFSQSPLVGLGVLVTIIIVQFIEGNLLQPIVMSKTMKLHPVTIMLGLLVFGHFWGIIGMIVATPIVAIIKVVFTYFDKKYKLISKN